MKNKLVLSVSVCTALLAASAAVSGAYATTVKSSAIKSADSAYSALLAGRYQAAVSNYTSAIESRKLPVKMLASAFLNRALAHQNARQYRRAIDDYTAALNLDTISPGIRAVALYNRGLAHQHIKADPMAIEDFTSALLLDPSFAKANYSRANVLRRNGQYLFAIADYKAALRKGHALPHLSLFGEAVTYEAMRQKSVAKVYYMKALAEKPDFREAKIKLASLNGVKIATVQQMQQTGRELRRAGSSDTIITGSIAPSSPDLVVRKNLMPKAVAVPWKFKVSSAKSSMLPFVTKIAPARVSKADLPKTAKDISLPPVPAKIVGIVQPDQEPVKTSAAVKSKTETVMTDDRLEGWTVQLSSQRQQEAAWNVWKKLASKHASLLSGQKAKVVRTEIGSRGVFYRLRVHKLNSKRQAASLCSKLKRRGTSCFISHS